MFYSKMIKLLCLDLWDDVGREGKIQNTQTQGFIQILGFRILVCDICQQTAKIQKGFLAWTCTIDIIKLKLKKKMLEE